METTTHTHTPFCFWNGLLVCGFCIVFLLIKRAFRDIYQIVWTFFLFCFVIYFFFGHLVRIHYVTKYVCNICLKFGFNFCHLLFDCIVSHGIWLFACFILFSSFLHSLCFTQLIVCFFNYIVIITAYNDTIHIYFSAVNVIGKLYRFKM